MADDYTDTSYYDPTSYSGAYDTTPASYSYTNADFPSYGEQAAPPGAYWNSEVGNWQAATPSYANAPSYTDQVSHESNTGVFSDANPAWAELRAMGNSGPGFGAPSVAPRSYGGAPASPGARTVAQQTPQMITMGKPEDDLYQRYKSLLMNPDFSQDPTYKFLYNQGLQGLNRSLAARRMTLSGNAMDDTFNYGAGMASKYMQDLLPQYRAGASEELQRFLGPAGLLPRYQAGNNTTIGQSTGMVNNAADRQMYGDMLANPGGYGPGGYGGYDTGWGGGIGYGGMGSRYTTPPPGPLATGGGGGGMNTRPMNYNVNYNEDGTFDPYYTGYDASGGPSYG